VTPQAAQATVERELRPGESLLWSAASRRSVDLSAVGPLWPSVLVLLAIPLAAMSLDPDLRARMVPAALFSAVAFAVVLYRTFDTMPVSDGRTAYGVTTQRVLIVREGRVRRVTGLRIGRLSTRLTVGRGGQGHIRLFGEDDSGPRRPGAEVRPRWFHISPPGEAEGLLRLLAEIQYSAPVTATGAPAHTVPERETHDTLSRQLAEGEALLWTAVPLRGVRLGGVEITMLVSMLGLTALLVWLDPRGVLHRSLVARMMVIAIGVYGACTVLCGALKDAAVRRGTAYAVTSRRVLIVGRRRSSQTVVSLDVEHLSLELLPTRRAIGTILFLGLGLAKGSSGPFRASRRTPLTQFEGIEDAAAVFRLIHQVRGTG